MNFPHDIVLNLYIKYLYSRWWLVTLGSVEQLFCDMWRWISKSIAIMY